MESTDRRLAQLSLLSKLGQALNSATSLHSLCAVTSKLLLEHEDLCGIVIRPRLYGTPPPKTCYSAFSSDDPALQIFLLQQDSQLSSQVLHQGRNRLHFPLSEHREQKIPTSIYSLPLRVHDRNFGTLSFFGSAASGKEPFTAEQQQFFQTCAFQIAQAFEQLVTMARLRQVSASDFRRLQDLSLLYRITQLLHSTLSPNELFHLILSLLVSPDGGSFHRAALFMANPRSGTLQGILGVTHESANLLLPDGLPPVGAPPLQIPEEIQQAQHNIPFSREIMQQRVFIENSESCVAIAAREQKAMLITKEQIEEGLVDPLCRQLHQGHHATVPLLSRGRTLCVLAIDNGNSGEPIDAERLRFLEMFAGQAGIALDNAQLLQRVETAHRNLQEAQEQLLQKEKLATIGEMSASIAHELKNPLVSVGGFARRLSKSLEENCAGRKYAEIIQGETERLEKMLDDILSFSKRHLLCISEYNLQDVLDRAVALEGENLREAHIQLQINYEEQPTMQGDAEQIEQVLINLLTNARQAMTNGGELEIRVQSSRLRGEPAVRIEIHDTGGGIPPKQMRNIFNPFFTTKEEGTGLGLPISHRIIEHHQGEIEALNTASGAQFSVILPVRLTQRTADPIGQQES